MKKKLSTKQEAIVEFIKGFLEDHHFPPTVRDIQAGCEISSTSVVDYNLRILQREGYIRRRSEVSRGIELLKDSSGREARPDNVVAVPVFGSIAAGEPLHIPGAATRSDADEVVDLPSFLTRGNPEVFAVRVKGESMIDALVADGDLVVLEPAADARNGDMVAAEINGDEVTLKHFFMQNGTVTLQPANAQVDPIVVPADKVQVKGKVVGVVRSMYN
ncbi:MAG: transcriptional repressor LexA [Dehalococcoidia bacterium]|nr:transcriptional repressor LexA [Dehalococcoidia bacterium]MYB49304.1 transcriptional repressor LexA [Dehalococcoidia bacterium]MYD50353.1 transcriptional repressor LexA [Dehalococcoidia bacterium]